MFWDTRNEELGPAIMRHRILAGMSRAELAEKSGVSRLSIYNIETGRIRDPHWGTVCKLFSSVADPGQRISIALWGSFIDN
jgi:DNA-binding XRE family transcriptional regulator